MYYIYHAARHSNLATAMSVPNTSYLASSEKVKALQYIS